MKRLQKPMRLLLLIGGVHIAASWTLAAVLVHDPSAPFPTILKVVCLVLAPVLVPLILVANTLFAFTKFVYGTGPTLWDVVQLWAVYLICMLLWWGVFVVFRSVWRLAKRGAQVDPLLGRKEQGK